MKKCLVLRKGEKVLSFVLWIEKFVLRISEKPVYKPKDNNNNEIRKF